MLPGNSGTCWLGVLPSLHVPCVSAHGLLVGDRVPKVSVWPDCDVDTGRLEHARQVRTTAELMLSWSRFLAFSGKTPRRLSPSGKMTRKTVVSLRDGSRTDPLLGSPCNIM